MNGITNDLLEPEPSTSYGFMLLANNDKIPFLGIFSQSFFHQVNFPSLSFQQGGGARGVMVIVAVYGHDDTSSNPGPD